VRLLFYVSGHGFGHAVRTGALLAALRTRAGSSLALHVVSEAPPWLFTERDPETVCSSAAIDVGVHQPNGLDLDLPATLAAHEDFILRWEQNVTREAERIRDLAASLVVSDIPPLAFAAARRAGVPCVAIANFSWDWILEPYADADPRWRPIVARYREAYAGAELLFRLPLHGEFPAFPRIHDVGLLVHTARHLRAQVRESLGISPEDTRRLVLVSFGGFGSGPLSPSATDDLSAYRFVSIGGEPLPGARDWITLTRPCPIAHEELVAACDAVIGKPGYGTVAEVLAHGTRFLFLPREGFRESPVLEAALARWGCARRMAREDFFAGRWRHLLDALFAMPGKFTRLPTDGADGIARALLERVGAAQGAD
jgi:hypothetical protein